MKPGPGAEAQEESTSIETGTVPRFTEVLQKAQTKAVADAAAQRQQAGLDSTAKAKANAKSGGEPWWLKDLPWWMPPPPEWGPLPPTMYDAYYQQTPSVKPLSGPNTYPLFRRVEDLEAPMGANVALAHPNQGKTIRPTSDMLPPGGGLTYTNPAPSNAGSVNLGLGFIELASQLESRAAIKARTMQRMNSRAAQPGPPAAMIDPSLPTPPSAATAAAIQSRMTAMSGPQTIADHMIQPNIMVVPPHMRYDRRGHFTNYWNNRYNYNVAVGLYGKTPPFVYKAAPQYPPDPTKVLHHWNIGTHSPHHSGLPPHQTYWSMFNAYSPSKYDEPTMTQRLRLGDAGFDELDAGIKERKERLGGDYQPIVPPDDRDMGTPQPPILLNGWQPPV
jgi:hypothetical protein